jgi:hypothetical protein
MHQNTIKIKRDFEQGTRYEVRILRRSEGPKAPKVSKHLSGLYPIPFIIHEIFPL